MKKSYNIIGIMSGSSLDGLDIAFCNFFNNRGKWKYKILAAETANFPDWLKSQLRDIHNLTPEKFVRLDFQFGKFIGTAVNAFHETHNISGIDYISSHGHTAFHNPAEGYTSQIGSGAAIAAETNISTICDFRATDVAMGGEGAPLVPAGDRLLFGDYDYCLNLGGYSNISYEFNKTRIAFDICPVNKIINHLAAVLNQNMDKDGEMARKGEINTQLLEKLNSLEFYHRTPPKSLDDNWFKNTFLNYMSQFDKVNVYDKLRTVYEHIAIQIKNATKHTDNKSILSTGGGTHNEFLIERIKQLNQNTLIVPDKDLINYKEAIVFGFMGVLRAVNKPNCLCSVTGAKKDTVSGVVYKV
ncbi:MAG: anhydro-N-acetylmuramic acid kinase [Bacteroidales bacterium]